VGCPVDSKRRKNGKISPNGGVHSCQLLLTQRGDPAQMEYRDKWKGNAPLLAGLSNSVAIALGDPSLGVKNKRSKISEPVRFSKGSDRQYQPCNVIMKLTYLSLLNLENGQYIWKNQLL
jgi:hypothetical protein